MEGLGVLRLQTKRFIAEDNTAIVLTRVVRSDDGAGGTVESSPRDIPAQNVRVVPQTATSAVDRRTINGDVVRPDVKLVAKFDANVERGDTFKYNNMDMEVVWITDLRYEKIAEVVAR